MKSLVFVKEINNFFWITKYVFFNIITIKIAENPNDEISIEFAGPFQNAKKS